MRGVKAALGTAIAPGNLGISGTDRQTGLLPYPKVKGFTSRVLRSPEWAQSTSVAELTCSREISGV